MLKCFIKRNSADVTPVELGTGSEAAARLATLRATHGAGNVVDEAGAPFPDITVEKVKAKKAAKPGAKPAAKKSASKRRR